MADIDIEEHDVLQNPILRTIFPDLSILKKEIIEVNENVNTVTTYSNEQDSINTKTINHDLLFYKQKRKLRCLSNVTIVLKNINTFLMKSKRFCQYCLTLFPDTFSFHNHQAVSHKNNDQSYKNKNYSKWFRTSNKNCSDAPKNANIMVKIDKMNTSIQESFCCTCVHCGLAFPSEKFLIEHLYDVLNVKREQNILQKLEKKQPQLDIQEETLLSTNGEISNDLLYNDHLYLRHNKEISNNSDVDPPSQKISTINVDHCFDCNSKNIEGIVNFDSIKINMCKLDIENSSHKLKIFQDKSDILHCGLCDVFIENDIFTSHMQYHNSKKNDLNVNDLKKGITSRKPILKTSKKNFYLCNKCKCYLPEGSRLNSHNLACKDFIKDTCKYCGLALPKKNLNEHYKSHLNNPNLKLQDFKFYDLKTKERIMPCQVLPKCIICEKYFIHKAEIVDHYCNKEDNVKCPICGIKLSEEAYKLHIPFHEYSLCSNKNNITDIFKIERALNTNCNEDDQMIIGDKSSKNQTDLNIVGNVLTIYTCVKCDLSMNVYDEVIIHCQMHSNLNDIKLDCIKCKICEFKFLSLTFEKHLNLHTSFTQGHIYKFTFDILYFGSANDDWLKHVFGTSTKSFVHKFIANSIYEHEYRMKFEIIQNGLENLTVYKCEKCQTFVDAPYTYHHITTCHIETKKYFCKFCNLPFINSESRCVHEGIHENTNITSQNFQIVSFKQKVSLRKQYVLYQCRFCHILVDNLIYQEHECYQSDSKRCNKCGLVIQETEYNMHMDKHTKISSFNKDFICVILLGNTKKINCIKNDYIVPRFTGMVSDYTFYKCAQCSVCVRYHRDILEHYCLINEAKSACPKCDLMFDEGKLKGHLRLHDTDPYFTKNTIMIKVFKTKKENNTNSFKIISQEETMCINNKVNIHKDYMDKKGKTLASDIVKIYKCSCGLHFLNKYTKEEHSKGCGKIKIKKSKQDCLKCGLTFSQDVLFKHLVKHHKGKNSVFKYKVI